MMYDVNLRHIQYFGKLFVYIIFSKPELSISEYFFSYSFGKQRSLHPFALAP